MRGNFGDPDEIPAKPFDRRLFLRLIGYLKPFRKPLMIAGIFMLIASLSELAGPLILRIAIDRYIVPKNIFGLWLMILVYAAVLVVDWVATYFNTYLAALNGQKVISNLRKELFEHIQTLSFSFFDRRKAGKIMSRLTNDVNALNQFLTSGVLNVTSDLIVLTGIISSMLAMSWKLAIVTFLSLPFIVIAAVGLRVKVRNAFRDTRTKIAEVNSALQENISGVRVVQAFNRQNLNLETFKHINKENYQANLRAVTLLAIFLPMVEISAAIGSILVIWYGAKLIVSGEITIGVLAAFLGFVPRFFSPIRDLSTVWNSLQSAMASAERIFEILDTEPDIKECAEAVELTEPRGEVQFRQVTFSYDGENPVLDKVNLIARPGEKIALVGPTGAGKTSIVNLIARFYEPDAGTVLLDGFDLKRISFCSLRATVGVVLQDTFIFAGTVRENLLFGRPQASEEEVEKVARLTGADKFISKLPQGYETQVQERGIKLSTGQRQLLTITRALLADPRILVLDEATANIDVSSELEIQRALRLLMRGRTCFIIAHRLSTVREADRILVINDGKIVEEGNHEKLLAARGLYYRLYCNQFRDLEGESNEKWKQAGEKSHSSVPFPFSVKNLNTN